MKKMISKCKDFVIEFKDVIKRHIVISSVLVAAWIIIPVGALIASAGFTALEKYDQKKEV